MKIANTYESREALRAEIKQVFADEEASGFEHQFFAFAVKTLRQAGGDWLEVADNAMRIFELMDETTGFVVATEDDVDASAFAELFRAVALVACERWQASEDD